MGVKQNLPKTLFSEKGPRAVLLLHAYSGSPNDVRMLHRFLEKHEYTVYSPMFKGHGTLEPLDILQESPEIWWENVLEALAFLKEKGHQQIAVLGLSMGGIFAMQALTTKDRAIIGGGAFCSPVLKTNNTVPESFVTYAQQVYKYSQLTEAQLADKLATIKSGVAQQLTTIEAFGEQTGSQLVNTNSPVFLAQGGKDEMIDPKTVFQTAQQLLQTKLTLKWYPNSGHVITVDPVHKNFERDVLDFIEALAWNEGN